ncbi:LLM class flavin-dependent oxidoreductase [Peribacillus sp. SI8-4]|uniref:LLM class flavin-dependent oxidoreductase n=1 Tax=Peribacillus sp. SI8-4 TaxID=3048009 RepID=UPI0025530BC2|nr:LLM class flavin-dependent oxidoreductase [Peribacillus sp. SI8-4]
MSYTLGILDQSPIFPGATASGALQQTIKLARYAEEWGYNRFWVSEHHHAETLAGSSPEVLISHLLAQTKSIRVGSGGVMLQHYSPYKVAENFHVLSNLSPGRVDLGIGKAPGGLPLSTKALQYGTVNDGKDFEERVSFLQEIIENSINGTHPLAGVQATPLPTIKPEMFLLGASTDSARLAANLGIAFVFARFINSNDAVLDDAASIYRSIFPTGSFKLSVSVIAAPAQQEANELIGDQKIVKVHLASGRTVTVQTIEQAEIFGKQAGESYEIEEQESTIIAGTPAYVTEVLTNLHERYGVDEFILHTPVLKEAERLRSFQLLSPLHLSLSEGKSVTSLK